MARADGTGTALARRAERALGGGTSRVPALPTNATRKDGDAPEIRIDAMDPLALECVCRGARRRVHALGIGAAPSAILTAHLALDQPLGNRAAIDGDERATSARAELVQVSGDELLTRSRCALVSFVQPRLVRTTR